MSKNPVVVIGGCLAVVCVFVGVSALGALLFQALWNVCAPDMFGARPIGFGVAWAATALIGIVGGSFRGHVTVKK